MPRVVHFEVYADDVDRAIDFYKKTFGWEFKKWDGPMEYWLVMTGDKEEPGIDGGLMKRPDGLPSGGVSTYYCTINVDSVDSYVEKVKENGGKVMKEKMAIPGVGWMAALIDTEGNKFGLMEEDISAA